VIRPALLRLQAHEPLAGQVQIDLLFHLAVGQVVERLQEDHFEQHQWVPGWAAVVGTVAITHQLADETESYGLGDSAQQMICGYQLVVDHAEKAALGAVLSLHSCDHRP